MECHCPTSHCNRILFSGGPLVLVLCWVILAVSFSSCLTASGAGSGSFLIWSTDETKYTQFNTKYLSEGTTLELHMKYPGPHFFLLYFCRSQTIIQLISLWKASLSFPIWHASLHHLKGHWSSIKLPGLRWHMTCCYSVALPMNHGFLHPDHLQEFSLLLQSVCFSFENSLKSYYSKSLCLRTFGRHELDASCGNLPNSPSRNTTSGFGPIIYIFKK